MAFPKHFKEVDTLGQILNLVYHNQKKGANITTDIVIEVFEIFDEDDFCADFALAYLIRKGFIIVGLNKGLKIDEQKIKATPKWRREFEKLKKRREEKYGEV